MARMIPPYINPDVKSAAERKIFDLVKNASGHLTCLHSLGVAKHVRKKQGEIDFVIILSDLILCLEVKGGRVGRKEGVWFFTDRYGQENRKVESPFAQASSGMYSLQAQVESHFGRTDGYLFGYGVLFPDIRFQSESPEWDLSLVYDLSDASKPFDDYIRRVSDYWHSKFPGRRPSKINESEMVDFLRGDFEGMTPLWGEVVQREKELARFTDEQYRALDHMEGNPKVIFSGGAGTGKTLLAFEKARRVTAGGKSVLLLCFNKLLGAKFIAEGRQIGSRSNFLTANSVHKFFSSVIAEAGLSKELEAASRRKGPEEVFNVIMPRYFIRAVQKTGKQFDYLIIDEGQDLLSRNYLSALDAVISGGLKSGSWAVFLDPGAQAKLFNRLSFEAYTDLKSLGAPEYRLDINCRNTVQIATQASIVSNFPTGRPRVDGPRVEYHLCGGEEDAAKGVVELVRRLIEEESVPPSSITVLSPRATGSMSLLATGIRVQSYLIEITENNIINFPRDSVGFVSAAAFKGLENNIIIYTDLSSFNGDWNQGVNYVGMTRAREKLYIFMDKRLQEEYQEKVNLFTIPKTWIMEK